LSDAVIREEMDAAMQRLEKADSEADRAQAAVAAAAAAVPEAADQEPTQLAAERGAGVSTRRSRRDDRNLPGAGQVGFS
jgi:hypothetical protein